MSYLSDSEKAAISSFLSNVEMRDAVRKTLEYVASKNELSTASNPVHLGSFDDERIGQIVRAQVESLAIIRNGFQELSTFAAVETKKTKIITGR